MSAHPQLGDWVEDEVHPQRGRVTAIHGRCPESDRWIAMQRPALAIEHVRGPWVSILVDGGGSVVRPAALVRELVVHPATLDNKWADHYGFEVECDDTPRPIPEPDDRSKDAEWYSDYVAECEAENLEPLMKRMWRVHGRPSGPLG